MTTKGANKKFCERYKNEGRQAINKARRIATQARLELKQKQKKEARNEEVA